MNMISPDGRGRGWGTPEINAELEAERHERQTRSAEADRRARQAATERPRVPWYRRLFRRP